MQTEEVKEIIILLKNGEYKKFDSLEELKKVFKNKEKYEQQENENIKEKIRYIFNSEKYTMCTKKILINLSLIILVSDYSITEAISIISEILGVTKQTVSDKLYRAMNLKSSDFQKKIIDYLNKSENGINELKLHLIRNSNNEYDKKIIEDYFEGNLFES